MTVEDDIQEAWAQAGGPTGYKVALSRVRAQLRPEERVNAVAPGRVEGVDGLVVVSSSRLLFVTRSPATTITDGFALDHLVHVEATPAGGESALLLATQDQELVVERMTEVDATELGATIKEDAPAAAPRPARPAAAAVQVTPAPRVPASSPAPPPPLPPPPPPPPPIPPYAPRDNRAQAAAAKAYRKAQRNWFARHKVLTAVGGIFLLIAVIVMATNSGGSGGSSSIAPAGSGATAGAAKKAGVGVPVRDGKFEFVVQSFQCGQQRVGTSVLGQDAQGQFCLVKLSVKNTGDRGQGLFAGNQKLVDSTGRQFDADSAASIYLDSASQAIYAQINPGNSVVGTVVFDVPKDFRAGRLELHDSAFSGGVQVALA